MKWSNIDDIVFELENEYYDEDISEINIHDLKEMVISLSNFEDYDTSPSDVLLREILDAWIILRCKED
jgi:FeS assembly protein IscX